MTAPFWAACSFSCPPAGVKQSPFCGGRKAPACTYTGKGLRLVSWSPIPLLQGATLMTQPTRSSWGGLLLAGLLMVPFPASAADPPPPERGPGVAEPAANDPAEAGAMPSEVNDPAFARYLDLGALRRALAEGNPQM